MPYRRITDALIAADQPAGGKIASRYRRNLAAVVQHHLPAFHDVETPMEFGVSEAFWPTDWTTLWDLSLVAHDQLLGEDGMRVTLPLACTVDVGDDGIYAFVQWRLYCPELSTSSGVFVIDGASFAAEPSVTEVLSFVLELDPTPGELLTLEVQVWPQWIPVSQGLLTVECTARTDGVGVLQSVLEQLPVL